MQDYNRLMGGTLLVAPIIPVLTIERLDQAVPLARALCEGGLPVLEVTLRSDCALAAMKLIAEEVPEAVVGAGTVTTPEDLERVEDAGASFAVSPGLTPRLLEAAVRGPVPLLPGVATPSEVMLACDFGLKYLKLFPAEVLGGVSRLKAFAGPFADLKFCPTGGVKLQNLSDYLSQPNVICVGGTWLTPKDLMAAGDWAGITKLASEAVAKAKSL
ncbi:bifunctional 4-hydroxy-2-oxoglutarate aldolase/2-dehydro-3-deoxy-phosphogluconate aldolase [Rhodovibrionaceae bacterium A322]